MIRYLIFVCALAPAIRVEAQAVLIVDNNANAPTGPNIYTGAGALQNAINAAAAGDIVYIQPSLTNYGNATLGKKITLKGVGFNIPEIAPRTSTITNLTIINSSDGVHNISDAVLTGFVFNIISFLAGVGSSPLNNILMENITGTTISHTACISNVGNLVIRNCYTGTLNLGHCSGTTDTKIYNSIVDIGGIDIRNSSNLLITNNLIYRGNSPVINAPNSTNVRIEHNIFTGNGSVFADLFNGLVINNIFFGTTPATNSTSSTFRDNTFSHNISLNTTTWPPAGNSGTNSGINNINGVNPLFTNASVVSGWGAPAQSHDYTLQAGSPCINTATTGENIGPSGGLHVITNSVTFKAAAIPVITQFGTSGVVPQNQPLISNIKAKSN